MSSHEVLFPSFDQIAQLENSLSRKLDQVRRGQANHRTTPKKLTAEWLNDLKSKDFDQTDDLEELVDWTIEALGAGTVHTTHPGYLGLFNPAPTFPSECADRIVSAFNPQICVYSHAPAAVEIERHVVREIGHRAGLPDGSGGHFTSGGAEANSTAVLCALQAKFPDYGDGGLVDLGVQPTIYVSHESHLAWLKMAHAAGIGRNSVRLVKTDGQGRMDAAQLETAINEDLNQGKVPVLVAATAGTTNAGMIDPLVTSSELAEEFEMWFHVDAAWGGALIASEPARSALDGIELADSITIDAHKWFATTMGAGMFLTSRPEVLEQVFRVSASYMPESEASKDYYVSSTQWSRRLLGLRMFLALGSAGWKGYSDHVEQSIRLIDRFTNRLKTAGWIHANNSSMGVSCMVPPEGHNAVQRYVDAVHEDSRFWVSKAMFEGSPVLRACVTNGRTDEAIIDQLTEFLVSV